MKSFYSLISYVAGGFWNIFFQLIRMWLMFTFTNFVNIKTSAMCNACPKAEQCLLYTSDSQTSYCALVVWVTNCFNSSTIQWSPLNNLRVLESRLNGEAFDFSRFFWDSGFWKPERPHPIFTCSKTTIETPERCAKYVQS